MGNAKIPNSSGKYTTPKSSPSPKAMKNSALNTQSIPAGKRQQTAPAKAGTVKKACTGKGHTGDNING